MKIIGVIPARWASTRFPGKILAQIHGKPMVQHVWQQAKKAKQLDEVIIACDDEKVRKACETFGATVVVTSPDHASGTDRIVEAVSDIDADIVVNIQGDEPMLAPDVINCLVQELCNDDCPMGTVIKRIDDPAMLGNPNVVKVVIDHEGYALYFSRYAIPYNRDERNFADLVMYKHFGLYAYRKDFLMTFNSLPTSMLEQAENLEQLRVLEAGHKIKTIQTDAETVGVDTPEDLERVAFLLSGEVV